MIPHLMDALFGRSPAWLCERSVQTRRFPETPVSYFRTPLPVRRTRAAVPSLMPISSRACPAPLTPAPPGPRGAERGSPTTLLPPARGTPTLRPAPLTCIRRLPRWQRHRVGSRVASPPGSPPLPRSTGTPPSAAPSDCPVRPTRLLSRGSHHLQRQR